MSQQYEDSVELVSAEVAQKLALSVMFAALTGVLAQVAIPLPVGVPFTLQPRAVFFAVLVLGAAWGGFALVLYLVVGIAGAPVFANFGAGLGIIFGVTGGFLIGFVVAAVVGGAVAHRSLTPTDELSVADAVAGVVVALGVIYVIGVPWWMVVADITFAETLAANAGFFTLDVVKAAIAVWVVTQSEFLQRQF